MSTLDFRRPRIGEDTVSAQRQADRRLCRLTIEANQAVTEALHRGERSRGELLSMLLKRVDTMTRGEATGDGEFVAWLGLALAELEMKTREDQS